MFVRYLIKKYVYQIANRISIVVIIRVENKGWNTAFSWKYQLRLGNKKKTSQNSIDSSNQKNVN